MKNLERYNLLHTELIKRLEDGEITTEQAKELNNRFFDKYVDESVYTEGVLSTLAITTGVAAGVNLLIAAGFSIVAYMKDSGKHTVTLKGNALDNYRKLVETYLKDIHHEINPKQVKYKKVTPKFIMSADNKDALIEIFSGSKNGFKYDKDKYDSMEDAISDSSYFKQELFNKEYLIYKNTVLLPGATNLIKADEYGILETYCTGMINKNGNPLNKILKYYKDNQPEEYEKALQLKKDVKKSTK